MPRPADNKNAKKLNQISVKVDADLYQTLLRACGIQQHREGQLARILIEWALPFYEAARSVEALNASAPLLLRRLTAIERQLALSKKFSARDRKHRDVS